MGHVFSCPNELAQSRGAVTATLVRLDKALGGGWQPDNPPY